jgi:hypothetical protein
MLNPEQPRPPILSSVEDSAAEFHYVYSTFKDKPEHQLLIRYAEERLKTEVKKAKKTGLISADDINESLKKGAQNSKKKIEYEKVFKAPLRRDRVRHWNAIESVLNLPTESHEKPLALFKLAYLAYKMGLKTPHVVAFCGVLADSFDKEPGFKPIEKEMEMMYAHTWATGVAESFDKGLNWEYRFLKVYQIMWLEAYLSAFFSKPII